MQKSAILLIIISSMVTVGIISAQGPRPQRAEPIPDDVLQVTLNTGDVTPYSQAMADQVAAGDGNGIDGTFRNSGVVIDEEAGLYYAVNGVHPVNQGDYTSYYPKSIIAASLEDDSLVQAYSFDGLNGHEVDMEGLTFAEDPALLYIGDEYNYIYEMALETGDVSREWDLADIGVSTGADRGIEAITYSSDTGYFYVGIQDSGEILTLDLALDSDGTTVTLIDSFTVFGGYSPSGLFAHPDGALYVVTIGGGRDGQQLILQYALDGTLSCAINIPEELGMARPDGIYIDSADEYVYIVDSQGPLFGGNSLYKVAWNSPCGG